MIASPLFVGCDGGDTQNTGGGGTTTTTDGGGGTTSTGGGGTGGTGTGGTTQGGGGTGGTGGTTTTGGGGTGGIQTGDYDCSPAEGAVPPLQLTEVAGGFNSPVFVRAAPGDDERLYVVEKTGRIRILKGGVENPEPFLDISDRVQNSGEQGLLGLAFHPKYAENGRFFVFYTNKGSQDQNVAEYSRSADPELATAEADGFGAEVQLLLKVDDSESNHNGGMIDFSPVDGFLYIGLGDEGGGGDNHGPFGNGLNLGTLWGKIARIDVNTTPYSIPAGNMTAIPAGNPSTGAVLPEIWSYGLRNPWRFAFDPCNGDMYIGDVGQGQWEEVDVEPAGVGGRNYGWKAWEGTHEFNATLAGEILDHTPPVAEYSHAGGNCSITGGFLHRSSAIPGLRGRYFYGDYCTGRVWSFLWDGTGDIQTVTEHTDELDPFGNITSFGSDNQGNVYIVANDNIFRIDAQ